jgi:hypothetical protein
MANLIRSAHRRGAKQAYTPPAPPATNASGIALPGAVSGWTLTMAEDFDTAFAAGAVNGSTGAFPSPYTSEAYAYADGTKDTSGNNNGTNSVYMPSTNLSCTGSKLVTLCNVVSGQARAATWVAMPGGTIGQLYGRFSVCYRVPTRFHGFKIAFLMWPNSDVWPRDGEIDWPEGSLNTGGVFGANFLHQGSTAGSHAEFDHHRYASVPGPDGSWHVATLEWASTYLAAYWDGTLVGVTYDRIPNTAMYWALQTETDLDGYPTTYPTTGDTGTVEIDWIATWTASSPTVPGAGSAPTSTTTLTEPFTGTTGNWSSTNWNSTTTTTGASATLSTNQGLQTTGTIGGYGDLVYRRSNTALPTSHVMTATVSFSTVAECYPFICFRDATSGTAASGYQLLFYAANSQVVLANPVEQQVAVVNWGSTWTTSTSLKVEIQTLTNVTYIRVWDSGGSRPTNPSMTTNTSSYPGTTCGLGLYGGNTASSRSVRWDDFTIASVP